jgi:hypothetical protein
MKLLQTLGAHGGQQIGIFQYRRTPNGVHIDASIGQANLTPAKILFTSDDWNVMLHAIRSAANQTFRLTGVPPFKHPPNESLYHLMSTAVPYPVGGWQWNDSWRSYICAILEHEGSIDLYHGPLGPKTSAIICLARDVA